MTSTMAFTIDGSSLFSVASSVFQLLILINLQNTMRGFMLLYKTLCLQDPEEDPEEDFEEDPSYKEL